MGKSILISTGNLNRSSLEGQVAIVSGAGRGIGFEAARLGIRAQSAKIGGAVSDHRWLEARGG